MTLAAFPIFLFLSQLAYFRLVSECPPPNKLVVRPKDGSPHVFRKKPKRSRPGTFSLWRKQHAARRDYTKRRVKWSGT